MAAEQVNLRLEEIREQGNRALRKAGRQLGSIKLDCTNVSGLNDQEFTELFQYIPLEWRQATELSNFIELETLNDEFCNQILDNLDRLPEPPRKKPWIKIVAGVALAIAAVSGGTYWIAPYFLKPKLAADSLTIGTLSSPENYAELEAYLEQELVPANFFRFLRGEKIQVDIDGNSELPYQEAQSRLVQKQWDIAFTLSPINSIVASDSGYRFAASMFPDSQTYHSGIFVEANSPIQSLDDIKPTTTIVLGNFTSASSFYLPVYALYGRSVSVNGGHRGHRIPQIVAGEHSSGEKADLGAAAIGDTIGADDSNFRILHVSSEIPGSGVYLSPDLSVSDHSTLQSVLLNAPQEVKEAANYGRGEEPDYSHLRKIVKTVDEILICADFSNNPVNFFCPPGFKPTIVVGEINGATITTDKIILKAINSEGSPYSIYITSQLLEQAVGTSNLSQIQGKAIQAKVSKAPQRQANGTYTLEVTQPSQFKLLEEGLVTIVPTVNE